MIIDKENLCSEDLPLTTVATSWSDVIDMGDDDSKIQQFIEKAGELFAQVTTAFDSAGDTGNLTVGVYVDDDAAMGGTPHKIAGPPSVDEADLVEGYRFMFGNIPAHISHRYLAFRYVVAREDFTSGKITAGIVLDKQTSGMMPL